MQQLVDCMDPEEKATPITVYTYIKNAGLIALDEDYSLRSS